MQCLATLKSDIALVRWGRPITPGTILHCPVFLNLRCSRCAFLFLDSNSCPSCSLLLVLLNLCQAATFYFKMANSVASFCCSSKQESGLVLTERERKARDSLASSIRCTYKQIKKQSSYLFQNTLTNISHRAFIEMELFLFSQDVQGRTTAGCMQRYLTIGKLPPHLALSRYRYPRPIKAHPSLFSKRLSAPIFGPGVFVD